MSAPLLAAAGISKTYASGGRRIVEYGPARDVVANPQSQTARSLIAAVPRLLHA